MRGLWRSLTWPEPRQFEVETQSLINVGLGIIMLGLGWFARELWDAVKELKKDFSKLREDLPKTYVSKEDWRPEIQDIKNILGKIFDKLENKADK